MSGLFEFWPKNIILRHSLEMQGATPSNNVIKGMHFHDYKALRRRWQLEVLAALGRNRPTVPLAASFLVVTRECAGSGLDWDNAYGGLKPLLDCLVFPSSRNPDGLGVIQDDSPKHMPYPPFLRQLPAKLNKSRTKVDIFEFTQLNR